MKQHLEKSQPNTLKVQNYFQGTRKVMNTPKMRLSSAKKTYIWAHFTTLLIRIQLGNNKRFPARFNTFNCGSVFGFILFKKKKKTFLAFF